MEKQSITDRLNDILGASLGKTYKKVLLIDETNTDLSQILELILNEIMDDSMEAESAGIDPGDMLSERVMEAGWDWYGVDLEYIKDVDGIREKEKYDYVIPLGIRLPEHVCESAKQILLYQDYASSGSESEQELYEMGRKICLELGCGFGIDREHRDKAKKQMEENAIDGLLWKCEDTMMMPKEREWEIIYRCMKDSDSSRRNGAAKAFGIRCNEEDEERLRRMSFDKDELVRINAVENMERGIQEKTLKCLYEWMRKGGWIVRSYAVSSFFSVWVNRNGYTKSSVRKCWRKMEKLYKKEEYPRVLADYEAVKYLCGDEKGLAGLKAILCEGQGQYYSQHAALNLLQNIRNIYNAEEINRIIEDAIPYMDDAYGLKRDMKDALETRVIPTAFIIDRENAGLSQMLTYLSGEIEEEVWIESAGLFPAEETRAEVGERLGKDEEFIKRYYYPRKVRQIYNYDFIVPLGIKLDPEKYPFHKIVPLFEEVNENMLDVKKAKEMLKELKAYIDNDNH